MIEINSIVDQNFVWVASFKVTTHTTAVNLNKYKNYMVRLTSHISLECPKLFSD